MPPGTSTVGAGSFRRAASFPLRWRQPKWMNRQTRLRFRLRNLSNQENIIRLVLGGTKVYYPEVDKAPHELLGRYLMPRQAATSGSGNPYGVRDPGPWLWGGVQPIPTAPGWRSPG